MRIQGTLAGAFLIVFTLILAGAFRYQADLARAQSADDTSNTSSDTSGSSSVDAYRQQLQSQLDAINAQIAQQQQIVTQQEQKSKSLQSTIAILDAQIKSAKLA